jgi:tetratricopeptide (TPR) repeat protein
MMRKTLTGLLAILLALGAAALPADEASLEALRPLQMRWAEIQYRTPADRQAEAFEALAREARRVSAEHPGRAEPLVWEAIILSTEAGARGGLGALGLVKQARKLLLEAESIDPGVLDGSVYTSLGSLYYQVPGWPLGFGDDDKAREYLRRALAMNPDGIDPNYFYGDFLIEEGQYAEAVQVLEHALEAPARPGRELADSGRREEVRAALAKARAEL